MCPLSRPIILSHAGHARDAFCGSWDDPQIGIAGRPSAPSPDDDSPVCCMGRRTHPTAQLLALILPDRAYSINARGSVPGRHAVFPMATGQGLPSPCGSLPAWLLSAGFIPWTNQGGCGAADGAAALCPLPLRKSATRAGPKIARPSGALGSPGGSRMISIRSRAAGRTPAPGVGA